MPHKYCSIRRPSKGNKFWDLGIRMETISGWGCSKYYSGLFQAHSLCLQGQHWLLRWGARLFWKSFRITQGISGSVWSQEKLDKELFKSVYLGLTTQVSQRKGSLPQSAFRNFSKCLFRRTDVRILIQSPSCDETCWHGNTTLMTELK